MTVSFESYKNHLLETFGGEVTPEAMYAFQSNLIGLVRNYKTDSRLPSLLKSTLETLTGSVAARNLQTRVQEDIFSREVVHRTVQEIFTRILRPEQMKTILRSTIEALESSSPETTVSNILPLQIFFTREEIPSSIEAVANLLPIEDLNSDVIRSIIALFQDVEDEYARDAVFKHLSAIAVDQRVDVIQKAVPILLDISRYFYRGLILFAVGNIPEELRSEIIATARPFFKSDLDQEGRRCYLLQALAYVTAAGSDPVLVQRVADLFEKCYRESSWVCRAIEEIPEEERLDVITRAAPLCKDLSNGRSVAGILRTIMEFPRNERVKFLEETAPFLPLLPQQQRAEILETVRNDIAPEIRSELMEKVVSIFGLFPELWVRGVLLMTTTLLPEQRTFEVIRSIGFLFREVQEDNTSLGLLEAVQAIPPEQRADAVVTAARILWGASDYDAEMTVLILNRIAMIPVELRSETIAMIIPLIENVASGARREEIFETIMSIPSEDRSSVIAAATPYFKDLVTADLKGYFLAVIAHIPLERLTPEGLQSFVYLINTMGISFGSQILPTIEAIPWNHRVEVIEKILPILQDYEESHDKMSIFSRLATVAPEMLSDVIIKTLSLLVGIKKNHEAANVFTEVYRLLRASRADVIEKAVPFLSDVTRGNHKVLVVITLAKIPAERWTPDVIRSSVVLFQNVHHLYEMQTISKALERVPEELRADVILKAVPFFKDGMNGFLKGAFLRMATCIPEFSDPKVLASINVLFHGVDTNTVADMADMFSWIEKLPLERRAWTVITAASCFEEDESVLSKKAFLGALIYIPARQHTVDIMRSIVVLLRGPPVRSRVRDIFAMMKRIPEEQRADVIKSARNVVNTVSSVNSETIPSLLHLLYLTQPEKRAEVETLLIRNPSLFSGDLLVNVCNEDPSVKVSIRNRLSQELTELANDSAVAMPLAELMIDFADFLGIHSEDESFQKAVEIRIACSTDTNNPKNPYRLYRYLKESVAQEAPLPFLPPEFSIEGESVAIDLDRFGGSERKELR